MKECEIPRQQEVHWFCAPQGLMLKVIKKVFAKECLINVLGYCYCGDWASVKYSTQNTNPIPEYGTQNNKPMAPMMLQQCDCNTRVDNLGFMAILHMLKQIFLETMYDVMQEFLERMQ